MESRIIYHINNFVAFLFGEKNKKDPEQRMYNKLLQLEGDELETWMNTKLKKYIICAGYYWEFQGDEFEGIQGPTRFKIWYTVNSLQTKFGSQYRCNSLQLIKNDEIFESRYRVHSLELMKYDEIFDRSDPDYRLELYNIKIKIRNFQGSKAINYERYTDWKLHIMSGYMEMFILSMSSDNLKSYIIQQVDPVEIR